MRRRPGSGGRLVDAAHAGADEGPGRQTRCPRWPQPCASLRRLRNVAWACKMRRVPLFACFFVRNRDGWDSVPPAPPTWGAGDAHPRPSPSFPNREGGTSSSKHAGFPHQPVAEVYKSLPRANVLGNRILPLSFPRSTRLGQSLSSFCIRSAPPPSQCQTTADWERQCDTLDSVAAHQVSTAPTGRGVSDGFAQAMSLLPGTRRRFI
jgi:hypothetical protein